MFHNEITYGYGDISIKPSPISNISHRSECNVLKDGKLPIFTAPMSTVINEDNFNIFEKNGINAIIPRNIDKHIRDSYMLAGKWVACSLSEFEGIINEYNSFDELAISPHILIDVANGNMKSIFDLCKKAKEKYGQDGIVLMAGNIANSQTYIEYCRAGIDYARCSVGSGAVCITATQTSIHYGIVNLLNDINTKKKDVEFDIAWNQEKGYESNYKCLTKVIADGGIRDYADVVKALALGADYVMVGSVFARLIESCAPTYFYDNHGSLHELNPLKKDKVREQGGLFDINESGVVDKIYKVFYGMASKRGQEDLFGEKKKTSEGIIKNLECTTNIDKWVQNMRDYLASAMSYCNIKYINDFNNKNVETYLMSPTLQNSINK